MKTESHNYRMLNEDEDADARIMSFFGISGILSVVMVSVFLLSPPADIGVAEGQLAPNFSSQAYDSSWSDFELYDHIDQTWATGDEGEWILLLFIDTDCPYCFDSGDDHSAWHSQWGASVQFLTVATELQISGHSSSKGEIVDFKEKNDNSGCRSDKANCDQRPGDVHNWPYIDDLDRSIAKDYNLPGTPFYLLLSPDGIVQWNSGQHSNDQLSDPASALQYHLGGSA
ncbi:MAG: hypothetical protein VYA86_03230 [Candidatus Thermoplasmatota archaeon]|nr:hypothetical protein [Candidatus Thermoplasmatota archaeon]